MICIDPKTRISISEVKKHPAFNLLLPKSYIFPSPIFTPLNLEPININLLNNNIKETLNNIGFNDEDLLNELSSSNLNIAKSFCYLISYNNCFNCLPWNENNNINLNNIEKNIIIKTLISNPFKITLPEFNNKIQKFLIENNFKWFFPNEFNFFIKKIDTDLNIILKLEFNDEHLLILNLNLIKGNEIEFENIFTEILI